MVVPYPLHRCSVGIITRCCKSIYWSENYYEVHRARIARIVPRSKNAFLHWTLVLYYYYTDYDVYIMCSWCYTYIAQLMRVWETHHIIDSRVLRGDVYMYYVRALVVTGFFSLRVVSSSFCRCYIIIIVIIIIIMYLQYHVYLYIVCLGLYMRALWRDDVY